MNAPLVLGTTVTSFGQSRFAIGSALLGLVIACITSIALANGQLVGL